MRKSALIVIEIGLVALIVVLILVVASRQPGSPAATPTPASPATLSDTTVAIGQRTKTASCVAVGASPDVGCSPGAVFAGVTAAQICVAGYSSKVRNVPESEKQAVYAEYGIASHQPGQYEVDHLISLELGGTNDLANLWPEAAEPTPGFHQKDGVEDHLHTQVCNGTITLAVAQAEIAGDWVAVYHALHP